MEQTKIDGFGSQSPKIILHIANRPPLDVYAGDINRPLQLNEAADIIAQTGNHWRKVFSILAKISFALFDTQCTSWQQYRDTKLLTQDGFEFVSFSPVQASQAWKTEGQLSSVSILCGFQYAETQLQLNTLVSHQQFAKLQWSEPLQCLVTPYFDWRQLNNVMLEVVISIIKNKQCSDSKTE